MASETPFADFAHVTPAYRARARRQFYRLALGFGLAAFAGILVAAAAVVSVAIYGGAIVLGRQAPHISFMAPFLLTLAGLTGPVILVTVHWKYFSWVRRNPWLSYAPVR